MAVFISYSHQDEEFVVRLAANLAVRHTHVWVDRWELNVGDSLLERIQGSIRSAAALLFVLSPASVTSVWCRKEVNAALMRELDERRVVVLPVLLKDCDIPLFLREKVYADFRSDFDLGLRATLEAIAGVTATKQGRLEQPQFYADWSIDWDVSERAGVRVQITIVEQAPTSPYSVLVVAVARGNTGATKRFVKASRAGMDWLAQGTVLLALSEAAAGAELRVVLANERPKRATCAFHDPKLGIRYDLEVEVRRMGMDTGKDTLVDIGQLLGGIQRQVSGAMRDATEQERAQLRGLMGQE